jgi:prepilin signal peptidase PulO-like enzyme (type II secretory pathway)
MSDVFLFLNLTVFGLVFGSFITALSYRSVRGMSILKGRSLCPNCKKKISWIDNIPIISFLLLHGKSRCCKKNISLRYPLIEFFTLAVFFITGVIYVKLPYGNPIGIWKEILGLFTLPYLLTVSVFLITTFVSDYETKLIVDEIIFVPYLLTFFILILVNPDYTYANIFLSFAVASIFLLLHLVTHGRGMGLGDVKLVLVPPLILGWPYTVMWLFFSFVIGALVGLFMILIHKTKFGKQIPFGPFLIFSYFIVLFWGEKFLFLFNFNY